MDERGHNGQDGRAIEGAPPPSPVVSSSRGGPSGLALALLFLTVLPVRVRRGDGPPDMTRALPWFPVVGAFVGVVAALADAALTPLFARPMRDVAVLVVWALLTGLLHIDGFIDCCDALLGTRTVQRRLDILRDSRVGAYGAAGAALLFLALAAALGSLPTDVRPLALVAAPTLGRWAMVLAVVRYPYARREGAGSGFRRSFGAVTLATVAALLLLAAVGAVAVFAGIAPWMAVGMMAGWSIVAAVVGLAWPAWAARRLGGGLTGDTYGAQNELVQLAVLLAAVPVALLVSRFS